MTDAPEYLRAGAIARLSGVSLRTVRRWIVDGTLPSVKVGGARLVSRTVVEQVLSPAPWDGAEPQRKFSNNSRYYKIGKPPVE